MWTSGSGDSIEILNGQHTVGSGDGNDVISVHSSFGMASHTITTGIGVDVIRLMALETWQAYLMDFATGAGGDILDISAVLASRPDETNLGDYLSVTNDGNGNSVLSIDPDGLGGAERVDDVFAFKNMPGLDAAQMFADGNFHVG